MSLEKLKIVGISNGMPDGDAGELLKLGVDMAEPENSPKTLIIPTAKIDQDAYDRIVASATNFYHGQLGLPTEVLHRFGHFPGQEELEEKIGLADLVYISGGDTEHMMEIWKTNGFDALLKTRTLGGLIISGASAGAIAPFAWGHSDSRSYHVKKGESWEYIPVDGLGLINAAIDPHHNTENNGVKRSESFNQMFADKHLEMGTPLGIGIDNSAGILVSEGTVEARSTDPNASVEVLEPTSNGKIQHHQLLRSEKLKIT